MSNMYVLIYLHTHQINKQKSTKRTTWGHPAGPTTPGTQLGVLANAGIVGGLNDESFLHVPWVRASPAVHTQRRGADKVTQNNPWSGRKMPVTYVLLCTNKLPLRREGGKEDRL